MFAEILGLAVLVQLPAQSQPQSMDSTEIIMVLPFVCNDSLAQQGEALDVLLVDALADQVPPGTRVYGALELRSLLGLVQDQQNVGCDADSCLAEIGLAYGARYVVVPSLGRLGDTAVLSVRLVDSNSAEVLARHSTQGPMQTSFMLDAVQNLVMDLGTDMAWPGAQAASSMGAVTTTTSVALRSEQTPAATGSLAPTIGIGLAAISAVALAVCSYGVWYYNGQLDDDSSAWSERNKQALIGLGFGGGAVASGLGVLAGSTIAGIRWLDANSEAN
jgi:TolB-like protein